MQAIHLGPIPLVTGDDGVIRVAGTRVTLDSIVAAFDIGATPEEIVQQYPSIDLATVYAVVAYVLANRGHVESYLEARRERGAEVRVETERRFPADGVRARLLARQRSA
jgi:uncharacterized protein (DUF433 family)